MNLLESERLHVHPAKELSGFVAPPASKSSSARAILAASLAPGTSTVEAVATSNNVRAMMDCCERLGAELSLGPAGTLTVTGAAPLRDRTTLSPGNSGIVLRLLMGVAAAGRIVTFDTPFPESLGRRSNSEMLSALGQLGVASTSVGDDGRLPITLDGGAIRGGEVRVSARRSSQFLSGLLYLGGLLDEPLDITVVDELKAKPMVRTTLEVLATAGVRVEASDDLMHYTVDPRSSFQPARFSVGTDPASTAALLALAASVESSVDFGRQRLEELGGVLEYLREIGVSIDDDGPTLRVRGGGELKPLDFDGSKAPDAVLPLAALAAHADGTSRFYNIEHLRYKECDRISDFRRELEKAGVKADEKRDELIIHGSPDGVQGGVVVDSHYDHGVVLAMSLVALRSRSGLTIEGPKYVAQTYPEFFDDLRRLGGTVTA
jgi:3-phosphoshikimate 1-carboxyvinyltransferase